MASSLHGQRRAHPPPSPPPDERQSKRRRGNSGNSGGGGGGCGDAAQETIDFGTTATIGMASAPTMASASSPLITSLQLAGNAAYVHHHHHQQQQQQQQQQLNGHNFMPRTRPQALNLRVGNCSLEDALLSLPQSLSSEEHTRRQSLLALELAYQEHNPPILPPSRVQDLPPKPFIPEFLKFPADMTEAQRRDIEARNNKIAAEHQRVDRQRNNQAAKKSRQARLEALGNTRELLNAKAAECAWFRMKLLAMGGEVEEWDRVPRGVKGRMVREIEQRVKVVDEEKQEFKKREEARKRAERNRRRAEERNAAAAAADAADAAAEDTVIQGDDQEEQGCQGSYRLPEMFGEEAASGDEVKMEERDEHDA